MQLVAPGDLNARNTLDDRDAVRPKPAPSRRTAEHCVLPYRRSPVALWRSVATDYRVERSEPRNVSTIVTHGTVTLNDGFWRLRSSGDPRLHALSENLFPNDAEKRVNWPRKRIRRRDRWMRIRWWINLRRSPLWDCG